MYEGYGHSIDITSLRVSCFPAASNFFRVHIIDKQALIYSISKKELIEKTNS